jgi:hypothetical protein
MHLLPSDGREPFQKLVYGRALVKVFEKRGHWQSRATEAPCSTQLPWVSIDSTAVCPVHTASLPLIGRSLKL